MLRLCLIALLLLLCNLSYAQNIIRKYINHTLNDTSEPAKPKLIAYPTVAYAPETSWEFGISAVLVYKARQDTSNRLSEISSFSFVTLNGQYGSKAEHALYTHENKWFFLGELKFQNFPLSYYGIGPFTDATVDAKINATEFKFRERVLYKIRESLYTGPEAEFETVSQVSFDLKEPQSQFNYPTGSNGFVDLSLGWGVVYDNIHNALNAREGIFAEVAWLTSQPLWGSDFNFNSYFTDFRYYHPIKERNVIAAQVYGQYVVGNAPFDQISLMGGERIMRGYYFGRYRDNGLVAGQVEYRLLPFAFIKRLGGAVFAGVGQVFPDINQIGLSNFKWSVGGGPRFYIFPKKDVFTRFDVAFTEEGPGFYFFIGEAF